MEKTQKKKRGTLLGVILGGIACLGVLAVILNKVNEQRIWRECK